MRFFVLSDVAVNVIVASKQLLERCDNNGK